MRFPPSHRPALPVACALAALLALTACGAPGNPVEATDAELRAHVAWLADDARQGRRAGTFGEEEAARYIAQRFAEAGLIPAGENGSYFQEFPVAMPPEPGESNLTIDEMNGHGTRTSSETIMTSSIMTYQSHSLKLGLYQRQRMMNSVAATRNGSRLRATCSPGVPKNPP